MVGAGSHVVAGWVPGRMSQIEEYLAHGTMNFKAIEHTCIRRDELTPDQACCAEWEKGLRYLKPQMMLPKSHPDFSLLNDVSDDQKPIWDEERQMFKGLQMVSMIHIIHL